MKFFDSVCETVTRALGLAALAGYDHEPNSPLKPQHTLKNVHAKEIVRPVTKAVKPLHTLFPNANDNDPFHAASGRPAPNGEREQEISLQRQKLPVGEPDFDDSDLPPGPVFMPPNASPGFKCDYSAMRGWSHTAGSITRSAWLEKPIMDTDETGGVYNIKTNYDQYAPIGTHRTYHLNVTDQTINCDGMNRPDGGKVFNGQYPGPHIEACWGDTVEVTVSNHLKWNGTAVHWHGVRMLNSFEYDGVNAVTQCAIAPGDSFTYRYRVTQYGTSWYHSHYSLQYADGLAGPITFHGPSAADFDVALPPMLFGDWSHNSAFEDYAVELHTPPAHMRSVILNCAGVYNCTGNPNPDCKSADNVDPPPRFEQVFERGRKYLLRLINTSTASTFIFSIDKHMLKIVANDFVPIEPYYRDSILVGIGQRYHVIVQANPSNELIPVEQQNYWIRITGADGCFDMDPFGKNELLGVIRYNEGSTAEPTSVGYQFDKTCRDEPYESLVPVVPMTVASGPNPVNDVDPVTGDNFEIGVEWPDENYTVPHGNFSRWDLLPTPMWLNFSDPAIDHLGDKNWNPDEYCLVTEDYDKESWVYIIMTAQDVGGKTGDTGKRYFVPVAHPMHLHGHDFVLLAQENRPFHLDDIKNGTFKYDNPPRRDVALLPRKGYMAIGFKTDNPGVWILHCHIAWHASSGLAMNIRENEHSINLSKEVVEEKDRVCKNWRAWFDDKKNWFDHHEFQEDSGI